MLIRAVYMYRIGRRAVIYQKLIQLTDMTPKANGNGNTVFNSNKYLPTFMHV